MATHSEDEESLSFWTLPRRASKRSSKKKSSSTPDVRPFPSPAGRKREHKGDLKASSILGILQAKLAYLSGGLDKNGRQVITIPGRRDQRTPISYDDLSTSLSYLEQIPSPESKEKGFTVVLDLRGSAWKEKSSFLKAIGENVPNVKQVLIVKPDDFWEKRRSSLSYKTSKSRHGFETTLLSTSPKVFQHIEQDQVTKDLGGHLPYNHEHWIKVRQNVENFLSNFQKITDRCDHVKIALSEEKLTEDVEASRESLSEHHALEKKISELTEDVIPVGESIVSDLSYSRESLADQPLATYGMDADLIKVEDALHKLKFRGQELIEKWQTKKTKLEQCLTFQEYEVTYQKVLDWVTGPGFEKLSENNDIGDSVTTAEALKKEHEDFERSTKEYIDLFGQLRTDCRHMIQGNHYASKELLHRKKYLDVLCKNFAEYMEKKRNMINSSVRFHRHAAEFARRQDDLLELLCTETETFSEALETVENMLDSLKQQMEGVNNAAELTYNEGQKILESAGQPIFSATGTNITPDYAPTIKHVETVFDELNERKQRSDELCDVRKLRLQQCLQLRTCERDADQAIIWMKDLCEVMLNTQMDLGRNKEETSHLIEEHEKFENTAVGTYDYGKQLLSAALVLRRSCRYDLASNQQRSEELSQIWNKFESGIDERGRRLQMTLEFHQQAEKTLQYLEDLGKGTLAVGISPFGDKSEMLEDLREMLQEQLTDAIATGRTLLSHVETPLFPFEDGTPDDVSYRAEVIEELVNELRSARLEIDSLIDQKHSEDDSLENIQTKPKEKGTITEISLIDTKLNVDVPKKHLVTGGVIHVNVRDINASDWQPVVEEFVKEADEVREVNTMPDFDFLMNGVMEDETYQKQSVVSSEEMEDGVFDQSNRTDNKTEVDVISRADQAVRWILSRLQEFNQSSVACGGNLNEAISLKEDLDTLEKELKENERNASEICEELKNSLRQRSQQHRGRSLNLLKTLEEGWSKANNQLQKRRLLLDSSVDFHESAKKFSDLIDKSMDRLNSGSGLSSDYETAKAEMNTHHELRKNILELSMETLSKGQLLLEKLREATSRADINSRHATKSACYGIERTLEALQGRRTKLEEVWKQRKKLLEQCIRSCKLDEEIKRVTDWLRTDGEDYLETHSSFGDNTEETEALLEEHNRFEKCFKEKAEMVQKLHRDGQKLVHAGHFDAATIKYKVNKLDEMFKSFSLQLEQRRKILNQTHAFYRSSQPVRV